jgi:hypothetical protein
MLLNSHTLKDNFQVSTLSVYHDDLGSGLMDELKYHAEKVTDFFQMQT